MTRQSLANLLSDSTERPRTPGRCGSPWNLRPGRSVEQVMRRTRPHCLGLAVLVLSVATSLGCSSSVSHDCAGIGASGPAAATPEAARDAYLRTLLPQQTDIDYSAWKQVAESETSVSFRAPVETPALTVPGGQKHGVPYLLFVGKGDNGDWSATGGCV
jgi:hypothetical protein